ncbi:MAG: Gfo/Idh/MocA family protein [Nitrososphaerales archaeon]
MTRQIGIAIIGTGLQAKRRLASIAGRQDCRATCVVGRKEEPTRTLAEAYGAKHSLNWNDVVKQSDVDAVMLCTPPHTHMEMAATAMESGKHVLCEKPIALSTKDAEEMIFIAKKNSVLLKCGFNHRYHPAVSKLKEWLSDGKAVGKVYFIRARYGHGGRAGYEGQWRSDPKLVAGGQLMEHGIHVVDLFRMLLGDFKTAVGFTSTNYWPIAPLEDNAFALFRNGKNQAAFLHSSLTQWRNLFSFEVGGENAFASIDGLGGGYGVEKAILNPREFDKPFREEVIEFRGEDKSWSLELSDFIDSIQNGKEPSGSGKDGLEALRMVLAIYESSRQSRPIEINSV